jgi:hypothetical protein
VSKFVLTATPKGHSVVVNYQLIVLKLKEIVFRRSHFRSVDIQPSFTDIVMLDEVKLLSVVFTSKLTFNKHVNDTHSLCNQRFYLLKLLHDQGMPLESLTTVVNRIAYCLSAWGRFLSVEDENRINVSFSSLTDMASLTQFIMLQVCVNTLTERCLNLYKLEVIV